MCELIDGDGYKVIFTSSATEASNLAIKGICENIKIAVST